MDAHPEVGKTQKDWAEHFGFSRSYLAEILSGRIPGRKAIEKINSGTNGAVHPSIWFEAPEPCSEAVGLAAE